MKICHLTSAHPRFDSRIFFKECSSLKKLGCQVILVVADGLGDAVSEGIEIHDVGKSSSRIDRMFNSTRRVLKKALDINADIYHLHDPELMPIGRKLLKLNKKVIFDAHEDLPKQILAKSYLNVVLRHVLSWVFSVYEKLVISKFTGVIAATPFIRDKFKKINANTIDVNNFPILGELSDGNGAWGIKEPYICYVGGISKNRGILEALKAMGHTRSPVELLLAGQFSEADVEAEAKSSASWPRVKALGYVDRDGVRETLRQSMAGLVTLHPTVNYKDALPVKMFEYMSAGIPVIASDFPLWRDIIIGSNCGICVDPLDERSIANGIDAILQDPHEAESMGKNGRQAVLQKYNWGIEERKLLDYYTRLMGIDTPLH